MPDRLLSALTLRQWTRSYYWLDASGMALYFLAQIESLRLELYVPSAVVERLRHNRADSRDRVAAMFAEFADLNQAFQTAGVSYANLKGFTLSPDSCPDPALRCQLDFDFLVDGKDVNLCSHILVERGYQRVAATKKTWEFKSACSELASIDDFHKPKKQRCVELHFKPDSANVPGRDERLDRLCWRTREGVSFPSLQPPEQLVGQAVHILEHLCGAATRPAWLFEYKRHVDLHANDRSFWVEVQELAAGVPRAAVAIGVASLLATQLFGGETPAMLNEWTLDRLPPTVRLWVERYGRRAVLADFPGTKLYLLLREQLQDANGGWQQEHRRRLLPVGLPARIIRLDRSASAWKRVRTEFYQLRYILYRARFHVVEGLRYKIEAARWKRSLRLLCQAPSRQSKEPYLSNS